jgi:hypothetical protein
MRSSAHTGAGTLGLASEIRWMRVWMRSLLLLRIEPRLREVAGEGPHRDDQLADLGLDPRRAYVGARRRHSLSVN